MKKNFFEMYLKDKDFDVLNNLKRWNGLRLQKEETVAHHTFHVVLFTRLLVEEVIPASMLELRLSIIDWATFHDFDEMFDFDINHKVKYNKFNGEQIRRVLEQYKQQKLALKFEANDDLSIKFLYKITAQTSSPFIKKFVKMADWMSCVFYLKKEKDMGNSGVESEYLGSLAGLLTACIEFVKHVDGDKRMNLTVLYSIIELCKTFEIE